MTVLETVIDRQQDLWLALVGVAAIALVFRMLRPGERRALRVTWVLTGLSAGALAIVSFGKLHPLLSQSAAVVAVVLWGWAVTHLIATLVFRGLLPVIGLTVPRIAHDLTFTGLALAWGLLCLRFSGVDPSQLFTTSALITAVVAFSMQDTLGNVLGGVTLQLDNSL